MFQINQRMKDGTLEQMECQDPNRYVETMYKSKHSFMSGVRECWAVKIDDPRRPRYTWDGQRFVAPEGM